MDITTVIDYAFVRFEQSTIIDPTTGNCTQTFTFSKPGKVINGVYYPAESVTLFGPNLVEELQAFIRKIQTELTTVPQIEKGENSNGNSDDNKFTESRNPIKSCVQPVSNTPLPGTADVLSLEYVEL